MFLESGNCPFRGIDSVVVRQDKLDGHSDGADVSFNSLGAFIINDV